MTKQLLFKNIFSFKYKFNYIIQISLTIKIYRKNTPLTINCNINKRNSLFI